VKLTALSATARTVSTSGSVKRGVVSISNRKLSGRTRPTFTARTRKVGVTDASVSPAGRDEHGRRRADLRAQRVRPAPERECDGRDREHGRQRSRDRRAVVTRAPRCRTLRLTPAASRVGRALHPRRIGLAPRQRRSSRAHRRATRRSRGGRRRSAPAGLGSTPDRRAAARYQRAHARLLHRHAVDASAASVVVRGLCVMMMNCVFA
jgi:hypothetical protein